MSGLPINDLAKAIADATGWVQHIAELNTKEQVLGQLTNEIADTNRQLSQVKADAASVIAKLTAAAGGSANVDPK